MTDESQPSNGESQGIKTARWIVVGVLVLMALAAAVLGGDWLRRNFVGPRERARRISCASNLKSMGLALRMYSSDWNERFPPHDGAAGLELLRAQGYLENHKMYICPSTRTIGIDGHMIAEKTLDYQYFGGYMESDSFDYIVICDKEGDHKDYGNVLFIDGHVEGLQGVNWQKALAKARAEHKTVVGPRRGKGDSK